MDQDGKDGKQANYRLKREVWLPWQMLESEAFKKLSASEIKTYCRCYQKRTWTKIKVNGRKKTVYNDEFIFPYHEAHAVLSMRIPTQTGHLL